VKQLFLRHVEIFPPQGTDVRNNFFSVQRAPSEQYPGRRYAGICAPGKRIKTGIIRSYVAHLAAAQLLYEKYGKHSDPWMTLVGYFKFIARTGRGTAVGGRFHAVAPARDCAPGLANRRKPLVKELTSRMGARTFPTFSTCLKWVSTRRMTGNGKNFRKPEKTSRNRCRLMCYWPRT